MGLARINILFYPCTSKILYSINAFCLFPLAVAFQIIVTPHGELEINHGADGVVYGQLVKQSGILFDDVFSLIGLCVYSKVRREGSVKHDGDEQDESFHGFMFFKLYDGEGSLNVRKGQQSRPVSRVIVFSS